MYEIKKTGIDEISQIVFSEYHYFQPRKYCPEVSFSVTYSEEGFNVHFKVNEINPRREHNCNFSPVCEDSCVEWFVNFDPLHTENYFNIEINANSCADVSFRKNRYIKKDLTEEEIKMLCIKSQIFKNYWTVDYIVPFVLIKKYFSQYKFEKGQKFLANVYKCGDNTNPPHYACWKMVDPVTEEFHSPEHFGIMVVK